MHVRCPHCHNPIEVVDGVSLSDINCPSCGSASSPIDDTPGAIRPEVAATLGRSVRQKVAVEIIEGMIKGQRFEFEEHDTFIFGRSKRDCHAHLPDDRYVSRHHFILEVNPPDARVRDLGSRNGTYVNGAKYGGRHEDENRGEAANRQYPQVDLKDADIIKVGETAMRVHVGPVTGAVNIEPKRPGAPKVLPIIVQQIPACQRCGSQISDEISLGQTAVYTCRDCQEQVASDPIKFLQELSLKKMEDHRSAASPMIAGYTLGRELGRGGMGVVYQGERLRDKKTVAVKLMLSKIAVDPAARDTFLREIEVLRQLRHPNIVGFLDAGAVANMFYFVMEICEGGSLADVLRRRRSTLSYSAVGRIMLQSLGGLSYAHERGLVHRDLKPQNILLHKTGSGWVARISDFGLAKNFQKAGFSGMTATGNFAGTYPFMPREQLTNFKYVQPASDVWSIGATFYYLLTRKLPRDFEDGRDPIDVILDDRIVPVRHRDPKIPPKLAMVIDRAVASDVAGRFESATHMHRALAAALKAEQ